MVVVLSLAVGMGVNTAVFTLLNALALKPLPITNTEGLFFLSNSSPTRRYGNSSYPRYQSYADRNDVFSGLMTYSNKPLALTTGDSTEEINAEVVSGNYFSVLEVVPAAGRLFFDHESGLSNPQPIAVLSHDFWKRRYGSDPAVVGQSVILNGYGCTVVGVASGEFSGTSGPMRTDVWVPVGLWAVMVREPDRITSWGHNWTEVMGRLKSTVSREQAEAAMTAIAQGIQNETAQDQIQTRVILTPASEGHPGYQSEALGVALPVAAVGFIIGSLILLIGCVNAANLVGARAASRRKEVAIRLALGSSRGQLVRLLLAESLVLALLAGIAGLLFAMWGIELLLKIKPPIPTPEFSIDLSPDLGVFGFTLVLSLVTGILFGLTPALRLSRTSLTAALNEQRTIIGRRVRFRMRDLLVVSQVALSFLLIVTAGLFARGTQQAHLIDTGFDADNVYLLSLASDQLGLSISKPERFDQQVLEQVRNLEGIESASLVDPLPLSFAGKFAFFKIEGEENGELIGHTHVASQYFKTLGIALVGGRDFGDQDSPSAPKVAIINETMVRRLWPNQNPLGRRILSEGQPIEIVGIAKDTKHRDLGESSQPWLYIPFDQNTTSNRLTLTLLVRSGLEPATVASGIRREMRTLAPNWPVFEFKNMAESMRIQVFVPGLIASILGALGMLGLLLALVGISGLVSYSVTQRVREIGIRIALGAQWVDVMKLIVSHTVMLAAIGVVMGGAIAAALTRFLSTFLLGISPTDPFTFGLVSLALLGAAMVASIIPARKALRVDPIEALRCE